MEGGIDAARRHRQHLHTPMLRLFSADVADPLIDRSLARSIG